MGSSGLLLPYGIERTDVETSIRASFSGEQPALPGEHIDLLVSRGVDPHGESIFHGQLSWHSLSIETGYRERKCAVLPSGEGIEAFARSLGLVPGQDTFRFLTTDVAMHRKFNAQEFLSFFAQGIVPLTRYIVEAKHDRNPEGHLMGYLCMPPRLMSAIRLAAVSVLATGSEQDQKDLTALIDNLSGNMAVEMRKAMWEQNIKNDLRHRYLHDILRDTQSIYEFAGLPLSRTDTRGIYKDAVRRSARLKLDLDNSSPRLDEGFVHRAARMALLRIRAGVTA